MQTSEGRSKSSNRLITFVKDYAKAYRKELSTSQLIFMIFLLPIFLLVPQVLQLVSSVVENRKLDNPSYRWPDYTDFYITLAAIPCVTLAKRVVAMAFSGYYEKNLPAKYTGKARQIKIDKCVKGVLKVLYFSGVQVYGFLYVLSEQPYHAPTLFGTKSWAFIYKNYPYFEITPHMKFFYMVGLSYHVESWLEQMLSPPKSDFAEMFLHHLLTTSLMVGSYLTNTVNCGIVVMMILDHADIWIGFVRVVADVGSMGTIVFTFFGVLTSWFYTRIYVFPFEVVKYAAFDQWALSDGTGWINLVFGTFLLVLQVLNVHWFLLLGRAAVHYASSGERVDLQSADKLDTQKAKST